MKHHLSKSPNLHSRSVACTNRENVFNPTSANSSYLQPTGIEAPFWEQFTDGCDLRWQASHAKKEKEKKDTEEEWAYLGNFAFEESQVLKGIEGDKGLVLKDKAAHHAISAKFPKKVDNKGKDLVVQYEVKLQGM